MIKNNISNIIAVIKLADLFFMRITGICYLRAGDSKGSLLVKPGFERLKYVLLHNNKECHLYQLTKSTFQIWTVDELNSKGFNAQHAPYYAVLHFDNSVELPLNDTSALEQGRNTFTAKLMNIGEFVQYPC